MFYCKYCSKEFEKSYQIAAHISMCKANPNSRYNKFKKFILVEQICLKCKTKFYIYISENQYKSGNFKKFCSISCSNSRIHSLETKNKISKGVNTYNKNDKKICKCCGKEFYSIEYNKFCSKECLSKGIKLICKYCKKEFYHKNFKKYCTSECKRLDIHNKLSEGGRKGIASQILIRRSKNEKLFCKLCEEYFDKVTNNEAIFNGWDADVLIWDYKIAVLWNGKWHYEKITEKHSVEQVQNRDKIKVNEIKKLNWIPYIIKDMGKFNEEFVKEQFDIFLKYIKENFENNNI